MRSGAPSEVLAAAASYKVRVDSFLAGEVLAADIPVGGGSYSVDTTTDTIESATVVVPADRKGVNWIPGEDVRHPLAAYGQELSLTAVMSDGVDTYETPLGRVVITSWEEDGGDVVVKCAGVLQRVKDARLASASVPRKDGTLESEFRRLMLGGIPVDVSASLVDRDCPSSFEWDKDRIKALYSIIKSWPAAMVPDGLGGVSLIPDVDESSFSSVLDLTDGEGGTVASAPRSGTRDQVFNHWRVTGQSSSESAPTVSGEAFVTTGPYRIDGPYGDVVGEFQSGILETDAACEASAETLLAKSLRKATTLAVRTPVDPRIEALDPVTVTREDAQHSGWVLGYTMPLVPGDMQLTVSVFSTVAVVEPEPTFSAGCYLVESSTTPGHYILVGDCWTDDPDGAIVPVDSVLAVDADGSYLVEA